MVVSVVLFAVVLVSAEVLSMVDVMPDLPLTFPYYPVVATARLG